MRFLFLVVTISILLMGCTSEGGSGIVENVDSYKGQPLNIGVIGEKPKESFDKITFHNTNPDSLNNEEYDTYFITEEYFEELSTDEWTSVFEKIHTPVFFINLDVQAFIYRVNGMNYDETSPKATENTQGFVRVGDEIKGWAYGDPSGTTSPNETPKWIYNAIFRDIEEFLHEKESKETSGTITVY